MSLHPRSPIRVRHWSFAVLLVGTVALAACGGGSDGNGAVASLSGKSSKSSGSQSTKQSAASLRTQLLAYAKCMRDNGVDFPDPQFDSDGRPQFNRQNGGAFADLRNNPDFAKARTACESKRPDFAGQFQLTPEQQAQARKNLLKFAKCMRSKGVDFPDPTFDANGRPQFDRDNPPGGAQGQNRDDAASRTARQACQKEVGGNGRFGFGGPPRGGAPGGPGGTGSTGGGSGSGTTN
jgi:hypothetical protein